jgi:hypothetical protein
MKRTLFLMLAAGVLAGSVAAQTPASAPTGPQQQSVPITGQAGEQKNPQHGEDAGRQGQGVPVAGQSQAASKSEDALASNTPVLVTLSKTLDTKKAKEGDPVTAKVEQDVLSQGNIVLPHGARLFGHLTAAKAGGKDEPSQLGIAWDRAELKKGRQIPLHALIYALAPPVQLSLLMEGPAAGYPGTGGTQGGTSGTMGYPTGAPPAQTGGMGNPPGGPPGGEVGNMGGIANPAPNRPPAGSGERPVAALTPRSVGVQGMPGITLSANVAQGSVITGSNGNFKLPGGTQLVLRVVNQ